MDLTKNKNVEVIGLNYKDTKINAKSFLEAVITSLETSDDSDGVKAFGFGAYGVPETFIIDKNKIIDEEVDDIEESIEKIKLLIK